MHYFKRKIGQADLAHIVDEMTRARAVGEPCDSPEVGPAHGVEDARDGAACHRRRLTAYEPSLLCDRDIVLSGESIAAMASAEIKIARSDCFVGESELRFPLRRALARIEGIASVRTNGIKPDYRTCCYLDLAQWTCSRQAEFNAAYDHRAVKALARSMAGRSEAVVSASYTAFLVQHAVEHILDDLPVGVEITKELLEDLYQRISGGSVWESEAGVRTWDYRRKRRDDPMLDIYLPPSPARLPAFIDDLVAFCNRDTHTPITRSAIAHYQAEAAKMFTAGADQFGRIMAILMWRRAGLIEHYMPPFSITPAMVTERHTHRLEPYLANEGFVSAEEALALDEWVYHSAKASELSVRIMQFCHNEMVRILGQWTEALRALGVEPRKNLRRLMVVLLGCPAINIPYAVSLTGCSFTTVSSMFDRLVEAGVLRQVRDVERNRLFEAPAALALFEAIETALLPKTPASREALIERSIQDLHEG